MTISTNSLIAAMSALAREIKRLEDWSQRADEDDAELDSVGQEVMGMTTALGELAALYEERRATSPDLPPFDRLKLED
jgi:hypothetical protein